jgi:hypothetical protein
MCRKSFSHCKTTGCIKCGGIYIFNAIVELIMSLCELCEYRSKTNYSCVYCNSILIHPRCTDLGEWDEDESMDWTCENCMRDQEIADMPRDSMESSGSEDSA